jgi:hypothetical protein
MPNGTGTPASARIEPQTPRVPVLRRGIGRRCVSPRDIAGHRATADLAPRRMPPSASFGEKSR